jgi:hypothetical protein
LYSDLKDYFDRPFRTYLRRKVVVVRDFDSMPAGINFKKHIEEEIKSSAALITVIGKEWLSLPDAKTGLRRLDDPKDTHRAEIATALSLSIPVFPVLVEGASMPSEEELPDALKSLASQNAKSIGDPEWDAKVNTLIKDLELVLPSAIPSLVKVSGIAFLILLLGVLSVWGVLKYVNCCADDPKPLIAGSVWEFEKLGKDGKAYYGYVISFSSTGTYIFRCINKPTYPYKCRNEEWIDSKYQSFERKWELHGNKITIYWNMGDKTEEIDVGEVNAAGTGMKGTGQPTAKGFPPYSWSATRQH